MECVASMKQRVILIASVFIGLIAALLTGQYLSSKDHEYKAKLEQLTRSYRKIPVIAAKRNLPLAALRVISDDASHVLPPAALVAMQPDGGISIGKVLWSVMKKPAQIPALVRTGRASSKAFAELLRCRDLCGVGIAGLDL